MVYSSNGCELDIKQGPERAVVAIGEKNRKPVDPPPVVQLKISTQLDPGQNYLQSPYFFMSCSLVGSSEDSPLPSGPLGIALAGTLVSSLNRLKDSDNKDGAFFVFGDLSIKIEGVFRLQFNLYEMGDRECFYIRSIKSDPLMVEDVRSFRGLLESTVLTRSFSEQGVRLRLRKEPRSLLRQHGPASNNYERRRYKQQQNKKEKLQSSNSKDPRRKMQAKHVDPKPLPIHSPPSQYKQMPRGYSQSTASMSGYSDDTLRRRPRTDSGQGSTFGQHQSLDSPHSFDSFNAPFAQQQQQHGYFTQSPQSSAMSPREQYSAQSLSTPADNYSYDHSLQQSPQGPSYHPNFSPHSQAIHYHSPIAPSQPERAHSVQAYGGLGIDPRTYMSPALQASGMGMQQIPTYGRMSTAPVFGSLIPTTFGDLPTHSTNMGDDLLGIGGHSMNTTSAPGM